MEPDLRSRLIAAGGAKLADALLELAGRCDEAADAVERIAATPADNLERFRAKVEDLKRSDHFYDWREVSELASRLQGMLLDLEAADPDPRVAVQAIADFFTADGAVVESCDDSDGVVADVFKYDVCENFTRFARRIDDVDVLVNLLLQLLEGDEHGLRLKLIDKASGFLDRAGLERLVRELTRQAEEASDDSRRSRSWWAIELIAVQLQDAALFERTRLAIDPNPTVLDAAEIAGHYLDAGEPAKAIDWLRRFDDVAWGYRDDTRDCLLLAAYTSLGEGPRATEIAWRRFHRFRNDDTLDTLLTLIGEQQRETVIADEVRAIAGTPRFLLRDVEFLVKQGQLDEVESYVLARADQLDGGQYGSLRPIAEWLDEHARNLAATLVYRALLDTILARGDTAAYPYGARYLRRLDAVAPSIVDWRSFPDHPIYLAGVRKAHGRKYRFWQHYDEAGASGR